MRPLQAWWPTIRQQVLRARLVLLCCDFDGTLAPIADHPSQARLPTDTKRLLEQLASLRGLRVALVSGRALADLKRLVGLSRVTYVGNHGLEAKGPGLSFLHPQARRLRHTLHRLSRKLAQALRKIPGASVEWKGLTASLHWRNVPRPAQRRFHRLVKELTVPYTERGTIRVTRGKRVVEIRPRVDWDKGRVLEWLLNRLSGRHRSWKACVLYVGDDRTDEDAFKIVNHLGGLSVLVGRQSTRTAARYWLKDPHEVQRWLADLCHARTLLNATEGGA